MNPLMDSSAFIGDIEHGLADPGMFLEERLGLLLSLV